WIRQNLSSPNGVVDGRTVLERRIIPGIMNTVNRVSAFLREKAQFIAGKLNDIVGSLGQGASAIAGTILNFAVSALQWLIDRFRELVDWATDHLIGLANWVRSALESLARFLRPVLDFLRRVAAVVQNIARIVIEFGARIWNAIPHCI